MKKIVIIGSGLSGLSVASYLNTNKYDEIIKSGFGILNGYVFEHAHFKLDIEGGFGGSSRSLLNLVLNLN